MSTDKPTPTSKGLSFGLSIKKSSKAKRLQVAKQGLKPSASLGSFGEEEEPVVKKSNLPPPTAQPLPPIDSDPQPRLSGERKGTEDQAEDEDEVNAYDELYDQIKEATKQYGLQRRQGSTKVGDGGKKEARYMSDILAAAERRKMDRARAEERMVQREREAEGSEFADKESFVTEAFSKYREELEAMERAEEAAEARRAAKAGNEVRGMDHSASFFRSMLNDQVEERAAILSASKAASGTTVTEVGTKTEMNRTDQDTGNATKNDSGEVVDKRELLQAGLNIGSSSRTGGGWKQDKAALRQGYTRREDGSGGGRGKGWERGGRDRKRESAMLQEQLLDMQKQDQVKAEEEREILRTKLARKTDDQGVEGAKARYLARRRLEQEKKRKDIDKEEEDA
ncbi:coiled-coil domain-containing protein 55-domain containing protein [Piptocephalis cylindrospora]|uniref:Coiled-coil domain-containing protein 55-domain containing protein n=1 Tax=Piptocephalis cylindrospora TaxID=1907219 RepID=A0A4P9Y1V6_9FUNG|nr:coiled-coil domain-containing protein 55-domain containing protein [Piptocephalis cylindrospora]|eukprot:RKP12765.1 coiled-coil domain-containing protein 55-domain containing protein [Piptocephalis cylindrospora]